MTNGRKILDTTKSIVLTGQIMAEKEVARAFRIGGRII
jgi:hypothetical protein